MRIGYIRPCFREDKYNHSFWDDELHSDDRYVSYVADAIKELYNVDVDVIKPFSECDKYDLLLIGSYHTYWFNGYDILKVMEYIQDISKIQWYVIPGTLPTDAIDNPPKILKAKRFLAYLRTVVDDAKQRGVAEKSNLWTVPVTPINCEKEHYLLYAPTDCSFVLEHLQVFDGIPQQLYEDFGLEFRAYRYYWLDAINNPLYTEACEFIHQHLYQHLSFHPPLPFHEFQLTLAQAKIVYTILWCGYELQILEAWTHGTPVIMTGGKLDTLNSLLVPGDGLFVRDYRELYRVVKEIMDGKHDTTIKRTIENVRSLTNPEKQLILLESFLKEDL